MNNFAILTLAAIALAAFVYSQSTLALPDDAPAAVESSANLGDSSTEDVVSTADTTETLQIPERPADPEALEIFQEAQRQLFEHSSIRTRFRELIAFPGRPFSAEGTYVTGGPLQLRLEYQIELGDLRGTMLQVCDGQVSWTREEVIPIVGTEGELAEEVAYSRTSRRDVNQILREVEQQPGVEGAILVAQLGIGGLPAMLAGIERTMLFDHHETVEQNGRNFIVVEGRWRDDLSPIVQQFTTGGPERVKVFLAEENLFPERIVYLQRVSEEGEFLELLDLQFLDIEFNTPVNPEAFTFVSPPGTEEHDETQSYLLLLEELQSPMSEASATPPTE